MTRLHVLAALFTLMLPLSAFAQAQTDSLVPTIPESQITAMKMSSPYEFLSAATSADAFIIKAAVLAKDRASDAEVKALAEKLAAEHQAKTKDLVEAGKKDKAEIATPSTDGEQQGLLGKLEPQKGADFDRSFLEAQIFVHQRTIAFYRGYAGEANNLGKYAAANLPGIVADYNTLLALAPKFKLATKSQ